MTVGRMTVGRRTENRTTTLALLQFFRKNEERRTAFPSITMSYCVNGITLLVLIAGVTLLSVGITFGSAPLLIGGIVGLAVSSLIGAFSRMH